MPVQLNIEIPSAETYEKGYIEPNDEWCLIDFPYTNRNRGQELMQTMVNTNGISMTPEMMRMLLDQTNVLQTRPRQSQRRRGSRYQYYQAEYSERIQALLGNKKDLVKIRELMKETPVMLMDICLELMRVDRFDATIKSVELAEEWLTEEEVDSLIKYGYMDIISKKYENNNRFYRVLADPSAKVLIYENKREIGQACGIIDPHISDNPNDEFSYGWNESFVIIDQLMGKIIAIKTDEDYYLSKANVTGRVMGARSSRWS